jgi:Peptidase family M48
MPQKTHDFLPTTEKTYSRREDFLSELGASPLTLSCPTCPQSGSFLVLPGAISKGLSRATGPRERGVDPAKAKEQPYKAVVENDRAWFASLAEHSADLLKGLAEAGNWELAIALKTLEKTSGGPRCPRATNTRVSVNVASPFGASLSRRWERQADAFSLELTGDPETFESTHRRLAVTNLADLAPPRLVYLAWFSHPTPPERIATARALSQSRFVGRSPGATAERLPR